MSEKFQCGDNPALVGYLYDECEPDERAAISAHLAVCAACAAELATLESTRPHLASWAPPEAELGFQMVGPADRVLTPAAPARTPALRKTSWSRIGWRGPMPAWAQAAAAVLIFAAGVSIGVLRNTTGSAAGPVAAVTPPAISNVAAAAGAATVSAQDLAALEQRLRAEISQQARVSPVVAPVQLAKSGSVSSEDLAALEQRLRTEMAMRMTQFAGDFDMQRQIDLARIQQAFGQFDQTTGAEIIRQRQELNNVNNLIRTSLQGR